MASAATNQPCDPDASGKVKVVGTERVLLDEYSGFWPNDPYAPTDEKTYRARAFAQGQSALCLSGGGVRSAAFALGVLQALSAKHLLTGFHYLSTVSGGGYIGSWLQRWIHEEPKGAGEVMLRLGGVTEPAEVSALRENSNFITPRVGIGSNDTWTALSISGRNIALTGPVRAATDVRDGLSNLFAASVLSLPYRTTLVPSCRSPRSSSALPSPGPPRGTSSASFPATGRKPGSSPTRRTAGSPCASSCLWSAGPSPER